MKVRFILPVSIRKRFSLLQTIDGIDFGLVRMYLTPYLISWIIFTSDSVISLNRQSVGIPMGTHCAPLVADLFLFCYGRDCMTSLSADNLADIIEAFSSTSIYLDDLLNIDNPYFEGMVNHIYPHELQLNKAKTLDTEAPFDIVNFPFLDDNVPRCPSYRVYILLLECVVM